MSKYVDGEQEQLELIEPLVRTAKTELAMTIRRPLPESVDELLNWIAREAFRLGHEYAHSKKTVADDLWPDGDG
jgi:hypothetical protein